MTEREALLRAVCDHPDEDAPRLVFADWLQEHGDETRAEFIRAQVRFAELLRHGVADTESYAHRARRMWQEHGTRWLSELPSVSGLRWHDAFFRGFVEHASIASDTELVRHASKVFSQPIRHLVVTTFRGFSGFAELRGLERLKTLTLINRRPTAKCLQELLKCNTFPESLLLTCSFGVGGSTYAAELQRSFGSRMGRSVGFVPPG